MIRIHLPYHLMTLAKLQGEVELDVAEPVTQARVLDALEAKYPMLAGTLRDHGSKKRRPMIRFFACQEDISNEPPDSPLPAEVASGNEALFVIGAIAGGSF